jgi:hypothetical protein
MVQIEHGQGTVARCKVRQVLFNENLHIRHIFNQKLNEKQVLGPKSDPLGIILSVKGQ